MSFWSDLYAGDVVTITRAFLDGNTPSALVASANLPGVLPDDELPNSPDTLTELAVRTAGSGSLTFTASIAEHLGDADENQGAYLMNAAWVALFASLSDEHVQTVGRSWAAECGAESFSVLAELVSAIRHVCRAAEEKTASVVYVWSL